MPPRPTAPQLSVIVPAHQGTGVLPHSLGALCASDLPREQWELIVVDDASTDRTAELAERYADAVLRLAGPPHGPAYARNRGAEVARSDCFVFVDADVCVHADTLRRFAELFAREPDVGAVFGAYDTAPRARGLISQYRNLVHHYVHAQSAGEAETFWAGLGAIRREVFFRAGMFDEQRYRRPQIEDIELGHRVRDAGYRILLRPEIQGTHLKRWTLRGIVFTDVRDRGVPWMRLLLREGDRSRPMTLNLRPEEKLYTALVGVAGLMLVAAAVRGDPRWLLPVAACVLVVLAGNAPLLRWFARQRGFWFAVGVVPLRLLYYALNGVAAALGWFQHRLAREPAAPGADAPVRSPSADRPPPAESSRDHGEPAFREPPR